jgi:hypothetical protein
MKHNLMMIIGCGVPLLLIFLFPAAGLGSGWVLVLAIGAMFACHLMHFGTHNHGEKGNHKHEHQH